MEDVAAGTGDLTGLEILPTIVGLAPAGPVPPEAQGRPQPLLWAEKNWSGFVNWSHESNWCASPVVTKSGSQCV